MTDVAFVPTGRPVTRFVAAIAVIALLFGALWWTDLAAPRLSITTSPVLSESGRPSQARVTLRNDGPFPVTLMQLWLADPPRGSGYFEPPVGMLSAPAAMSLSGGSSSRVVVEFTVDCRGYAAAGRSQAGSVSPTLRVRVKVRGPLGIDTVMAHDAALTTACESSG